MAPPKLTPDRPTLERWLEEGLTHQQMAERVYAETGNRVTRAAISVALMGYGLTKPKNRYKDTIPWRVQAGHAKLHPAKMLRLLGRRVLGGTMSDLEESQLDSWLTHIGNENLIVGYDPDSDSGFVYIDAKFKDHDGEAPIRIKTLHLNREQ